MDTYKTLYSINQIEDGLDYDYSVSEIRIDSLEAFNEQILNPFLNKKSPLLYRGEQIHSLKNPLLPTLLRNHDTLIPHEENLLNITSEYLLNFYKNRTDYFSLFSSLFGYATIDHLYDLCAFSQHYMGCSPFIDFSKSLYVSLSFALMGRSAFDEDILLYVINIGDSANYTRDIQTADQWLRDYHVRIYRKNNENRRMLKFEQTAPTAKIIDIASNDSMKFQQGVFLLLDDFSLMNRLYFTKNVRSSVSITKYIINRCICPELVRMVERNAPWYSYDNLLEIRAGIQTALKHQPSAKDLSIHTF